VQCLWSGGRFGHRPLAWSAWTLGWAEPARRRGERTPPTMPPTLGLVGVNAGLGGAGTQAEERALPTMQPVGGRSGHRSNGAALVPCSACGAVAASATDPWPGRR